MQVGDGTTTVVILAGEFLREAKAFVEEGVHPQSIIRSFREAGRLATEQIKQQAVVLGDKSDAEMRDLLQKCASTSLNSKLVPCRTACAQLSHSPAVFRSCPCFFSQQATRSALRTAYLPCLIS